MRARGHLVVYDFWITDKMHGSEAYTCWWNEQIKTKNKSESGADHDEDCHSI